MKQKQRDILLKVIAWALVGFVFTTQWFLNYSLTGENVGFRVVFNWEMTGWFLWGLLFPLIHRVVIDHPIQREDWLRPLLYHLAMSLAFAVVQLTLHLSITWLLSGSLLYTHKSLQQIFEQEFLSRIPWRILVYFMLMIIWHAYEYNKRFGEQERRAADLELKLAQAQIQAMKMQLHPHFLFNTLNTISEMIHDQPLIAERMTVRLGEFLRMTLQESQAQEIPLEEELKFLGYYLEIEQVRFRERLSLDIRVDPAALMARVPNLLLQPIVENAVRHGIAPNAGPGRIEINAGVDGTNLRLQVLDNGQGIRANNVREGVGLTNTRARLEKMYNTRHRFLMENQPGGGLSVTIEIPLRM